MTASLQNRRRFEAWPDGPAVGSEEFKAYTEKLASYLEWLNEVEVQHLPLTRADFWKHAQRMRRLYYCHWTHGAGAAFDWLYGTESLPPPLTTYDVVADTLDRLFGTNNVMIGSPTAPISNLVGSPLDVSHLFAALDWEQARTQGWPKLRFLTLSTLVGTGLGSLVDEAVRGIATWVGDLASWFTAWNTARIKAAVSGISFDSEATRKAVQGSSASIEDLIGDIDAQIMTARAVKDPTVTSLRTLLSDYYLAPAQTGQPNVTTRWKDFLAVASPAIPHTGLSLDASAGDRVADLVRVVALLFLVQSRRNLVGLRAAFTSSWSDVSANGAVITAIASDFVAFLQSALDGSPRAWPSDFTAALDTRYGGFYLQPGDSDATQTYGGQNRTFADNKARTFVDSLQSDLVTLGLSCARTTNPSNHGSFDASVQWAVRHLQGYAGRPGIAGLDPPTAGAAGPAQMVHAHNPARYRGQVHGFVTPETARVIARWLAPTNPGDTKRRHFTGLRCPTLLSAWTRSNGVAVTQMAGDIWLHGDATTKNWSVYGNDLSGCYTIPAAHVDPVSNGVALGTITDVYLGGPFTGSLNNTSWSPESAITPASLIGRAVDPSSDLASVYRVVAAVAKLECQSFFDSANGYDQAGVSFGLAHWTLTVPKAPNSGELFAMLALFQTRSPEAYDRYFGVFGVQPSHAWPADGQVNWMWEPSARKYLNTPALYGLLGPDGTMQLDTAIMATDPTDFARLHDWHWWYRWIMACRDCLELRLAMWEMVRIRLRDILSTPWSATVTTSTPTSPGGVGGVRPATLGEAFTSEWEIALIYRYHVNYPASVVSGGHAGTTLQNAVASLPGSSGLDTSAWTQADHDALRNYVKTHPPVTESDVKTNWDGYDSGLGVLQTGAMSFLQSGMTAS